MGDTQRRSCYVNFAGHLLNAFNPNMLYPKLPYRWSDADWLRFVDMVGHFGFNCFEFWLTPRLFSRAAFEEPFGVEFARQMNAVIVYGAKRGVGVKLLAALTTVGTEWHTHCPNVKEEWDEVLMLWDKWTKRLPGLSVVGLFPGDPGGCSRNGCTPRTYIDSALAVAEIVKRNQPNAEVELGTWGPPFFGWGNIQGPPDWKGEFVPDYQSTAWTFTKKRADDAMSYLLKRLPDFPEDTSVAINLGFNPDGDPEAEEGAQDARAWARAIAETHQIVTWDYSLTEGEGTVIPHYRFERLFEQRKREREAAPYQGGICYTMSPMINQLSLFQSARSFQDPDGDPVSLTRSFYRDLFGPQAEVLAELLPLFEIVADWGNYAKPDLSREDYHARMHAGAELLRALEGKENDSLPFHPSPSQYRQDLLFFFDLFADLSAVAPDYEALWQRYWERVYAIYDGLPEHVDPRPRRATDVLIESFSGVLTP